MDEEKNTPPVSPHLFFQTIKAFQNTAVLRTAIDLDVFSALGQGKSTVPELALACDTSERGMRILVDYLVMMQFVKKEEHRYSLTPDSQTFLTKSSPGYVGGMVPFLLSAPMIHGFQMFTRAVRQGGTALDEQGTTEPEHSAWVEFAKSMVPMMAGPAAWIAETITRKYAGACKVLDIAAGHGLFGIEIAKRNPEVEVFANDWENVLPVALERARNEGLHDRYHPVPGSAFDVNCSTEFDVILLTNFLHHFSQSRCESLLTKLRRILKASGCLVTLEFVPNEDRVSPEAAWFSIVMLATTPEGDAYTFSEYSRMLSQAGFSHNELHALPMSIESVILSHS